MTKGKRNTIAVATVASVVTLMGVSSYLQKTKKVPVQASLSVSPVETLHLGWYLAPREGDDLRVTYATSAAPEKNIRILAASPHAQKILAWAAGGSTGAVAFVNRAVLGDREGMPGKLHAGYADADGTPLGTRAWDTNDLPLVVRALVREVDLQAAETALADKKKRTEKPPGVGQGGTP